jgi:hypothetical protein
MKNRRHTRPKSFREAVQATQEIENCYHGGLRALGAHSGKIELAHAKQCGGSVNIDDCVQEKYPNDNRWDYAFAYNKRVFFVEVHTASTGEVSTVLRKLGWLKDWLVQHAPEINRLKAAVLVQRKMDSRGSVDCDILDDCDAAAVA